MCGGALTRSMLPTSAGVETCSPQPLSTFLLQRPRPAVTRRLCTAKRSTLPHSSVQRPTLRPCPKHTLRARALTRRLLIKAMGPALIGISMMMQILRKTRMRKLRALPPRG